MVTSVLLRKGKKILKTMCRADTEGKAIQRLPHLGIHPIYSHHTQTLLWRNMARKLKIMENEKHPLDDLKNDEITKKREK